MKTSPKEWKWPLGIFLFYMTFVVATIIFVVFTFTQSRDLVVEDYYGKTLIFDQHMEKVWLAESLANPLTWEVDKDLMKFVFPEEFLEAGITGEIHLYRPSDASLDKRYNISVTEKGFQYLPVDNLKRGIWKVQVNWESGGLGYYQQSDLYLQ